MPAFDQAKRGYDPRAVDEYIKKLRTEYEKVTTLCAQYQTRIKELENSGEAAKVILVAQSAARQIELEAQDKASRYIAEARDKVRQTHEEAQRKALEVAAEAQNKADRTLEEAQNRAGRIVLQAKQVRNEISGEFEKLNDFLQQFIEAGKSTR